MLAGVFRGPGKMPVEEVPEPVAGPRDVVLDVRACGVCGSDLHAFVGGHSTPPGQIMGHEFAGAVLDVGREVDGVAVGDRLTGLPIQPCGRCRRCLGGAAHLCEVWTTRSIAFGLPGAFAERLRIPDVVLGGNVHRLPDGADFTDGALVEPTAVAAHAVAQAQPPAGEPAVVLGLGTIGMQVGQVLLAAGAGPVIGVDLSPLRREVGARLGMTTIDGAGGISAVRAGLHTHIGEREVAVVVEASGAAPLVPQAIDLVRPRGTVVLVALYHRLSEFDAMVAVQREVTIRGSANVTSADFREAITLLEQGRVRMQPLITHRLPLAEVEEAFRLQADAGTSVKVMVTQD
jgi:(R,R)-butanediol dehydrogenase / meso-butanediol dehydrogenase / diacetyl reductase